MEKAGKLISIIVGLALAAVVVFFGFRIFQQRFGQASAAPSISTQDITSTSFNVICEGTSANCEGQLMYDTSCSTNLTLLAAPASVETTDTGNTRVTYMVDLRTPDTEYFFKLKAGGTTFDNAGTCYTARTTSGVDDTQPSSLTPGPSGTATASASPAPTGQVGFFAPIETVTDCDVILNTVKNNSEVAGYNVFNYMKCLKKQSTTPSAQ